MTAAPDDARHRLAGRLTVFGDSPRDATLVGAAVAGIIPPHAPWALAVLGLGAWRARGEWRGEYQLHSFEGPCPRCGTPLELKERYVSPPLAVPCYNCHAQPLLVVGDGRGTEPTSRG